MTTDCKLIAKYVNGNYTVWLYSDGTKIKRTQAAEFEAEFPDSVDLKITDMCDMHCPMCHESSTETGIHGDLFAPFLNSLHFGTELAIGGGNPLEHPELVPFLEHMKERGIICNLTVNEEHFLRERSRIESLLADRLIWGLGISVTRCSKEAIEYAREHKTTVFHAVSGIIDEKYLCRLYDKELKLLILGYKKLGRGAEYFGERIQRNIEWLKAHITDIAKKFDTVSFDNLALEQLSLSSQLPRALFDERYMGDDGSASMFIDLVKGNYAVSSTSAARFTISGSVADMFKTVKKSVAKN